MQPKWSDELKTGIEIIDNQHKQIFDRTDVFFAKLNGDPTEKELQQEITDLFYFLTDYVITHFETEEKIQQERNYSNYEEHKKLHETFREKITNFKLEFLQKDKSAPQMAEQMEQELIEWLVNHIGSKDLEIKDKLN
jgi:hemerythrin